MKTSSGSTEAQPSALNSAGNSSHRHLGDFLVTTAPMSAVSHTDDGTTSRRRKMIMVS